VRHFGHWIFLPYSTPADSMRSKGVEVMLAQFCTLDGDGSKLTSSSMLACMKRHQRSQRLSRYFICSDSSEDRRIPMILRRSHSNATGFEGRGVWSCLPSTN
jgi:hypothetical protein